MPAKEIAKQATAKSQAAESAVSYFSGGGLAWLGLSNANMILIGIGICVGLIRAVHDGVALYRYIKSGQTKDNRTPRK